MISVNEIFRMNISETPYIFKGSAAINSRLELNDKSTWTCHYNTNYCKANYVKMDSDWFLYPIRHTLGLLTS